MNLTRFIFAAIAFALFCLTPGTHAGAQNLQSFVSTKGQDVHPCTRTHPCRKFDVAISQTNPLGEVIALDTGDYSAFTVSKPVAVYAAQGVTATIAPTSGTAVTISVGASESVVLRNLYLNSQGATIGVNFQSGKGLHVENCVVSGFSARGISADRDAASGVARLFVKDTVVRNGASTAIFIRSLGGIIQSVIDNCRIEGNGEVASGIFAADNARVSVRDSVSAGNGFGFAARSDTVGLTAELNIENCLATNNGQDGLRAGGGAGTAIIRVSNSTITNNSANGVFHGLNGSILSRGNNTLEGNGGMNSFLSSYGSK